ncbi:unnamed protein product, partial [Mesorhabditis belari]|uniref:Activin types I and II receptor domain-containing protein n=1 Tax=Mesorhabditis belari TaxID=2138241 RepID=A0AAF3FK35_9BILA
MTLGDGNIECYVGSPTPGQSTAQVATATLCANCKYCLKLSGTLGGATFTYRGCGCLNQQYPYTCSSTQTQSSISSVPGFSGNAYCCSGDRCNAAPTSSVLIIGLLLCITFF